MALALLLLLPLGTTTKLTMEFHLPKSIRWPQALDRTSHTTCHPAPTLTMVAGSITMDSSHPPGMALSLKPTCDDTIALQILLIS